LFEALVTVFFAGFAEIKNGGGKTTILKNMKVNGKDYPI